MNLFVYGTLAYDRTMRAVTGRIFPKRPCVLEGYARVAPPYGYAYILPREGASVNGYLVEGIGAGDLSRLDAYEAEGDLYLRREVEIRLAGRTVRAHAYVANPERAGGPGAGGAEASPGDAPRLVDEAVEEEAERSLGRRPTREEILAYRELMGVTIEEVSCARRAGRPLPREEMRRSLRYAGLPSLGALKDPGHPARPYAGAYLRMAVRHIVLSHIEERIAARFGGIVAQPDPYYAHAGSLYAALAAANGKAKEIDALIEKERCGVLRGEWDYFDYAVRGIRIASRVFDAEDAAAACRLVQRGAGRGSTPLGAELEFSRMGVGAIGAPPGSDPEFDGFYYFHDFDLMRRGWKLGMYVDNHRAACAHGERCRGFLEYAVGRWKVAGDISRPVSADPRILAGIIREAAEFCGLPPHSLHISLEIPPGRPYRRVEEISDLLCLLLLGGDLRRDANGATREARICNREIEDDRGGIYFSRENVHSPDGEVQSEVVEYQFPRLAAGKDFAPLITALKGIQLARNPQPVNPFMDGAEYRPDHPILAAIRRWAENPRPLGEGEISGFLARVQEGLEGEARPGNRRGRAFIAESLEAIDGELRAANEALR